MGGNAAEAAGGGMGRAHPDYHELITCRELVELVSAYLDGALAPAERARVAAHLAVCAACVVYMGEIETTIRVAGSLRGGGIAPWTEQALLRRFREWREDRLGQR